jgi:hypothetical protein
MLSLAALLLATVSCSKTPSWFKGKFRFDQARTTQQIEAAAKQKQDGLASVVADLAVAVAPQILQEKWGDVLITITAEDIATVRKGSGSAVKYEVFDKAKTGTVTIKLADGKVETWTQTETGISRPAENTPELMLHFMRVKE